jgi:MarR family transcriptional regulator, organic hydroperoxide resistance regulator
VKAENEGGFLIAKIHQVSGRIFDRLLRKAGLGGINSGQGRILFALWQEDGIPISRLSSRTQLEKSTLTAMLDRLEADGLIERVPSREDRRKILIRSTEKNRKLESKYLAVSRAMSGIFYGDWGKNEITEFEGKLMNLLDNLMREEKRVRSAKD